MEEKKGEILWIDDEIELLKPHIILLNQRGYNVETSTNGEDAVELVREKHFDLIFLDESMVGISGLDTLPLLKDIDPYTPVVMVTKNEAESLMEDAIGRKIDDYLTKPVNPAQILMACKKFLEAERIEGEKFQQEYLLGFNEISRKLYEPLEWDDWKDLYLKLVDYSIELDRHPGIGLADTLREQWRGVNNEFCKFVENNYTHWLQSNEEDGAPLMSPHIMDKYLYQPLKEGKNIFFIVVDCMRYDQWLMFKELLKPHYTFDTSFYCSILPTATPYARNAIFAGLFPTDIKKYYPQWWNVESNTEDHKQNAYEKELLESWIERKRLKLKNKLSFIKIFDTDFGKKIEKDIDKFINSQFTAFVINAVDMIAHSRSDYAILKEIAPDESAYRSLSKSWFQYSSLFGMLKTISKHKDVNVVLTTDHGSIRCMRGVKVLGDRDTSTNLRYKFGKNVKADNRHAMQVPDPEDLMLPSHGITVNNIIAKEDYYFVYPTDFHHYLNKYKDSFQHGGISLEEMIIPVINMKPR
ncbi:MAG: response regulator [Candidatus Kapaibacterium sp.]